MSKGEKVTLIAIALYLCFTQGCAAKLFGTAGASVTPSQAEQDDLAYKQARANRTQSM